MSGPEESNSAQPDNAPEYPAAPTAPPSFGQPGFAPQQPWDQPVAPVSEGPRPWWFQEPDSDEPDPNVTVDEVAIQRTTPVVPPSPGTVVAGPGVPSVDTRGAIPPEPLVPADPPSPAATPIAGTPLPAPVALAPADTPITGTPIPLAQPAMDQVVWSAAARQPQRPEGDGSSGAVWSADRLGGPATAPQPIVPAGPDPGPPLVSDAVLPDGQEGFGGAVPMWRSPDAAEPAGSAQGTAVLPALGDPYPQQTDSPWPPVPEAAPPQLPPPPAPDNGGGKHGGNRRLLLIGGGVAGALLVGAVVFAGVGLASGSGDKKPQAAPRTTGAQTAPSQSPSLKAAGPSSRPKPKLTGPAIDDARTDPKALQLSEVFPNAKMSLGARNYTADKTSVNHDCSLTARGAMALALQKQRCTSVVRATYINDAKKYAVTAGIAVLPTKAAAQIVAKAGNPATYEWFRGMTGPNTAKIDSAGGYASSTVLGRYVIYAYAQYADGTKPSANDTTLKTLSRQFLDYAEKPISKRAQQG